MTAPVSDPDDPPEQPLGAGIDWADPNSRLAPFYLSIAQVVGVALLTVIAVLYARLPLHHTDVWAHVRYGQWIAEARAVPDEEPLSPFTDKSVRWGYYPWLTQVAYHAAYQGGADAAGGDAVRRLEGGVSALRTVHLLLAVGAYGLWWVAFGRAGGSAALGTVGLLIVFGALLSPMAVQRPQLVGVFGFAAVMAAVGRDIPSRRSLVWVPLMFAVWANAHGSFVAGLALLGLMTLGRVIDEVLKGTPLREVARDSAARRLLTLTVASAVVAGLATPYGPAVYGKVLAFGRTENLATLDEWKPLDFAAPAGGHWLFLACAGLVVVSHAVGRGRVRAGQLLAVVAFGAWAVLQQRMMVWWVPLAVWACVPQWRAALVRWGRLHTEPARNFKLTVLAAVLGVAFVLTLPAVGWLVSGKPQELAAAVPPGTPWEPALALTTDGAGPRTERLRAALKTYPDGRFTGRLFASETLGDYFVWALPAEWPVLMYTHAHLFPADHWRDCLTVKAAGPGWGDVLTTHRVNLVAVEPDFHPELVKQLRADRGWVVVLDESQSPAVRNPRHRLFLAVRKTPLR